MGARETNGQRRGFLSGLFGRKADQPARPKIDLTDPEVIKMMMRIGVEKGDVAWRAGDLTGALHHFGVVRGYAKELINRSPDDPEAWLMVVSTHLRLGDMLKRRGKVGEARAEYEEGQAAALRLLQLAPSERTSKRSLMTSSGRLAEAQQALGDNQAASVSYSTMLRANEELAAAPEDLDLRHDLAITHTMIGTAQLRVGNIREAEPHFRAALEISDDLAAKERGNLLWLRYLMVSEDNVGEILRQKDAFPQALDSFRRAKALAVELSEADPADLTYLRDIAVICGRISATNQAMGQGAEAVLALREAGAIGEKLIRLDPANAMWRRDYATTMRNLGELLTDAGTLAHAVGAHDRSVQALEKLVAADPSDLELHGELVAGVRRLGLALLANPQYPEAVAASRRGVAVAQQILRAKPGSASAVLELARAEAKLGEALARQGERDDAIGWFRQGRQRYAGVLEKFSQPDDAEMLKGEVDWVGGALRDLGVRGG